MALWHSTAEELARAGQEELSGVNLSRVAAPRGRVQTGNVIIRSRSHA